MRRDLQEMARRGALRLANTIELGRRREEVESARPFHAFELQPPRGYFDPDSGRPELSPDAALVHVGRYFRRSRAYSGMSQAQLADRASVSQSMVSRVERARAPAMGFERFVDMCLVLGRLFPLGVCPHDHDCGWQPIAPAEPPTDADTFLEYLRSYSGER